MLGLIVTGCKPPVADTHPANIVGKWKAEFTTKVPIMTKSEATKTVNLTIGITTDASGSANLEEAADNKVLETISGTWKQIDDFLIIEKANGGFAAFRISTQSPNQLTVFARTGDIIQFNRVP